MLKDQEALAASPVVANSAMNRSRRQADYARELCVDPAQWLEVCIRTRGQATWVDLCCGEARALAEVSRQLHDRPATCGRYQITGLDLAASHDRPVPAPCVTISEANVETWTTDQAVDLVTCVHGLHYVGDKLGLLVRAASWLRRAAPAGTFVAHLDPENLRLANGKPAWPHVLPRLRAAGGGWNPRRGLLHMGPTKLDFGLTYVGADDQVGPNRTGQPAVTSIYRMGGAA